MGFEYFSDCVNFRCLGHRHPWSIIDSFIASGVTSPWLGGSLGRKTRQCLYYHLSHLTASLHCQKAWTDSSSYWTVAAACDGSSNVCYYCSDDSADSASWGTDGAPTTSSCECSDCCHQRHASTTAFPSSSRLLASTALHRCTQPPSRANWSGLRSTTFPFCSAKPPHTARSRCFFPPAPPDLDLASLAPDPDLAGPCRSSIATGSWRWVRWLGRRFAGRCALATGATCWSGRRRRRASCFARRGFLAGSSPSAARTSGRSPSDPRSKSSTRPVIKRLRLPCACVYAFVFFFNLSLYTLRSFLKCVSDFTQLFLK